MGTCIFHEGSLPPGFSADFEPALFNTPEFIALGSSSPAMQFSMLDEKRGKATAALFFQVENQVARSPLRAPFGSVECSESISPRQLYAFLEHIETQLRKRNVGEVCIKNPPRIYEPRTLSLLETILINRGYVVSDAEVGAIIRVTTKPFLGIARKSETLRARQAGNAGLVFTEIQAENFDQVFNFISDCHQKKGYNMSISSEQLGVAVSQFPGRYLFFAISDRGKLAAASVSVRVRSNILYNFLVNHDEAYNHLSPPVLLVEGTYEYCRAHSIGLFDLGTSAHGGIPNFPLLDFKLRMGGQPTTKFTFSRKLR